ncbi:hypothetical protein ACOOWA_11880 [Chryseobacterium sp. GP-SGM7]
MFWSECHLSDVGNHPDGSESYLFDEECYLYVSENHLYSKAYDLSASERYLIGILNKYTYPIVYFEDLM